MEGKKVIDRPNVNNQQILTKQNKYMMMMDGDRQQERTREGHDMVEFNRTPSDDVMKVVRVNTKHLSA